MKKLTSLEKGIVVGCIGLLFVAIFLELKPNKFYSLSDTNDLSYKDKSILVVSPLLTANAYKFGGFYTYFLGKCSENCLSVQIDDDQHYGYTSSLQSLVRFDALGARIITDYELNGNLTILDQFDKIVLLHNEYVTKEMFDAITSHPNVIYMYPNSLYAEVELNNGTMTLIRGHNYPKGVDNGFDWQFDNTRPEEFRMCDETLKWIKIDNGIQLECYPELYVMNNTKIFKFIRDV